MSQNILVSKKGDTHKILTAEMSWWY